jgi:RecA/RadA recombinase
MSKNKKPTSDKALENALETMLNSFGEGAVKKGSDLETVITFRTGHDDLDSVLSTDGFGIARGKVVEFYGPEAGGKCLTRDALCLTRKGLMTIEEIFNDSGLLCDRSPGFVEQEYWLINGNGKFEITSHFYKTNCSPSSPSKKTIKITTKDGFHIEGTYKHPIRILNSHGQIVWKLLSNIEQGDQVCILRNTRQWGTFDITEAEASFLGYIIGDGCFCSKNKILFSNIDEKITNNFQKSLLDAFGKDIYEKLKTYKNGNHQIHSKEFEELIHKKYKLDYVKSCDKTIPFCIRTGSQSVQSAFIRAYFDCDGYVSKDKFLIQFSSCSLRMLQELQLILLNMGIYSYITSVYLKKYEKEYYELEISGKELDNYKTEVGFNENYKLDRINTYYREGIKEHSNMDSIPNQKGLVESLYYSIDPEERTRQSYSVFGDILEDSCLLTYPRIKNIIDFCEQLNCNRLILEHFKNLEKLHYVYSEVVEIEKCESDTYDFTLPETHSFWSNGLISHNSSLALRVCGYAQKEGYTPFWIDLERALVKGGIAEVNGVDMEKIIIPDLALTNATDIEDDSDAVLYDAGKIMDMMVKAITSGFNPVVLDSVAALVTEREANAVTLNKEHMAEQARLMGKALRKINQYAANHKTCVIFINQERDSFDAMGNTGVTTPGGRALKFYSSQRIRISKINGKEGEIKRIAEDGRQIKTGHWARAKIVKNRCAAPHDDPVEIPIYYEKHFPDDVERMFEAARALQVITSRNNTITWKNESNGDVVFKVEGIAMALNNIRENNLINKLAADCVIAEKGDKNQKKKVPYKLPATLAKLAETIEAIPE